MVQTPYRQFENEAKGVWDSEGQVEDWEANREEYRQELLAELEPAIEDLINAGLSPQEARVAALKCEQLSHGAVAVVLDIDESTVGEYVRRVRSKRENADRLLDALRVHGIDL